MNIMHKKSFLMTGILFGWYQAKNMQLNMHSRAASRGVAKYYQNLLDCLVPGRNIASRLMAYVQDSDNLVNKRFKEGVRHWAAIRRTEAFKRSFCVGDAANEYSGTKAAGSD